MAGQEESKNGVPGKAPAPIKLHTAAGAAPRIVPQPGAAPAAVRTGNDDKTMRLKKQAPQVIKLTPQAESADAPAAAAPAPAPTPAAPKQTVRLVPLPGEQKTSTRRVPKVNSAAPAAAPAPAPAPAPSAPTVKLTPQSAASAATIKLTPQPQTSASAATIKLTPQSAASTEAASTVKLSRTGAAPSAPTVKLTPQAAASAATIKLAPQTSASAATIKLTPQSAAGGASQTIKLSDAKAPAAGAEGDVENAHTVKISRAPRTAPPMPAPASSAKPPSAIPGAKQTIKLRPSSMSSGISAAPAPASAPVQLNAGQANRTIKLVPVGNGGAQIAPPSGGAAPAAPVPGTSPAAQTVKLTSQTPAAAEQPTEAATVKLKTGGTGKTTLKLSLQKPSGTQTSIGENGQLKVPELTLPGKEKEAAAEKPSVVFLLISIAAMLAVVFTVLLMSVQFANMYHGANVNIPGMTRLSGTH